jgi:hypothetical protein
VTPILMIVAGLAIAAPASLLAERSTTEAVGTLGVEAGAALWFGGAVALSLRATTARRVVLVVLAAVVGAGLILVALGLGWTGAPLALAMEFGVGALAVVVVDVIVLGAIEPALDALRRRAPTSTGDGVSE